MKKLKKIALAILDVNPSTIKEEPDGSTSYFSDPVHGEKDYFSFADFSNTTDLANLFSAYLAEENMSPKVAKKLAEVTFDLKQSKKEDASDLSEFIYVMH